jgi:hypothetical protein
LKADCVFLADVERVGIPVPGAIHSTERMVIAKVYPIDLGPISRDLKRRAHDILIGYREYRARAQHGYSLGTRIPLMKRITGDNLSTALGRVMLGVADCHHRDVPGHAADAFAFS